MNAGFQRIARRDEKSVLSDQCKEIEENNRMEKTRDLFKKIRDTNVAGRGTPSRAPKLGSCLTLGNELSEETHVLTKQEILLGKGTWVESSR